VFELTLDTVTLTDQSGGAPLLIEGEYTGAIYIKALSPQQIEFGDGASEEVVLEEAAQDLPSQ
jgi:hypothetical protein